MEVSIGEYLKDVEQTAAELGRADVVGRLWRKDYTIWQSSPGEITDRLGWLDLTQSMPERVPELEAFAEEVRQVGFEHVVLLGMGGSSLAPKVFRQTFGNVSGYPELIVLDSTIPEDIRAVTADIEPERTLFLIASKSGTTLETVSLFGYFKELVTAAVGERNFGQHFVAITDPDTPLAEQAAVDGFRRIFLNQPDMGGRYSVLSYFGLVPAAVMGVDVGALLERAELMRRDCMPGGTLRRNPGVWLGVIMGQLALAGRDKLTLLISPALDVFGLWVEQLVAESTGKGGRGIVPIVGEPVAVPENYGHDRWFVCLQLAGDDRDVDAAIEQLKSAGQPVVVITLADRYNLGAEFFRWEMATAMAGAILGSNPFDQPDVETTKRATARILGKSDESDRWPSREDAGALADLLTGAGEGNYLAILAYLPSTAETWAALMALRCRVMEKYRIATMLDYGPRYLHSTGQLHKGGPETGLFLLLTMDYETDLPVPGSRYTFGRLAWAQAKADRQVLKSLGRRVESYHLNGLDEITRLV